MWLTITLRKSSSEVALTDQEWLALYGSRLNPGVPIADLIRQAREALGLSEKTVAKQSGLSIYALGDVESYHIEAERQLDLHNLKRLLTILNLDLFALFGLERPCANTLQDTVLSERGLLVADCRKRLGLSREALGDRIGYEEVAIQEVAEDGNALESWSLDSLVDLARVLGIQPWVLIGKTAAFSGQPVEKQVFRDEPAKKR